MLSKFYDIYRKTGANAADNLEDSVLLRGLEKKFPMAHISRISPGGTLGIFFQYMDKNRNLFLKTHRNGNMYCDNLKKEISLMSILYSKILNVDSFWMEGTQGKKLFLTMDFITEESNLRNPAECNQLICEIHKTLHGNENKQTINYDMEDVWQAAIISLGILTEEKIISGEFIQYCEKVIHRFEKYVRSCDRTICHGDLSNVNILTYCGTDVLVDWEDALMASEEYDFLYWLTFFSQRKYYSATLLQEAGINREYGRDIMITVLLIKSAVSCLNGSFRNNSMGIEQRMREVRERL